jgi:hypothetical protein
MLTKNSPEVQNLLTRIQTTVPGITDRLGNLWDHHEKVGIEMTFDQEPPTELLREFRPGHYSLEVLYVDVATQHELGWLVAHKECTSCWSSASLTKLLEHSNNKSPAPVWEIKDYSFGQ